MELPNDSDRQSKMLNWILLISFKISGKAFIGALLSDPYKPFGYGNSAKG